MEVVNFCRTPQWFTPRVGPMIIHFTRGLSYQLFEVEFEYSPTTKWIFRNVPLVMRWYRNLIMARVCFIAVV